MTVQLALNSIAMQASLEIADLELRVHGDHCLITQLLPILQRALEAARQVKP